MSNATCPVVAVDRSHITPRLTGLDGGHPAKINKASGTVIPVVTESVLAPGEDTPAAFLLGAHGGAGATTLAHSLAPLRETDVFPAADYPNLVAVVTAAHRPGLDAAHRIIRQVQAGRAGGCTLLGLIVVNISAGKMPKAVAQRLAGVADNVAQVWTIPYIEAWRTVPTSDLPIWDPTEGTDAEQKKRRRPNPLDEVDPIVVDVALDICRSAVNLYRALN